MVKNLVVIRLEEDAPVVDAIDEALAGNEFHPCSAQQTVSAGWQRLPGGPFAREVGGKILMRYAVEKRSVPASVIKTELKKEIERAVKMTGGEPSKSDIKAMKEDITSRLLARAFPKQTETTLWIDGTNVYIGLSNRAKAEEVFVALIQAMNGDFPGSSPIDAATSTSMIDWITNGAPTDFSVDDKCELVLPADGKPTVKYVNHTLEGDDVIKHLGEGKIPVSLAMTFSDKVSFILCEGFILKSIKFLDAVKAEVVDDELDVDGEFILTADYLAQVYGGIMDACGVQ